MKTYKCLVDEFSQVGKGGIVKVRDDGIALDEEGTILDIDVDYLGSPEAKGKFELEVSDEAGGENNEETGEWKSEADEPFEEDVPFDALPEADEEAAAIVAPPPEKLMSEKRRGRPPKPKVEPKAEPKVEPKAEPKVEAFVEPPPKRHKKTFAVVLALEETSPNAELAEELAMKISEESGKPTYIVKLLKRIGVKVVRSVDAEDYE